MSESENNSRDPNKYEQDVEFVFGVLQVSLDSMKERLAEPILRLLHFVDFMKYGDPEKVARDIADCAEQLRRSLYLCHQLVSESADRALVECRECAGELHNRWGEAAFCEHEANENLRRVKSRLDWLEAQRESRLQEHSPAAPELRAKVLALTGGRCAYCDAEITPDTTDGNANFVVEHVVPKVCGGPDHFNNYVPACSKCNAQKSAGHVLEFIQRRLINARVEIAEAAE